MKRVQIKAEYNQLHEMATAFGVRLLGTALVVISGFYRFPRQRTLVSFLSDHCRRIEVDYQSGSKQPHSKGSADLCTGFTLYMEKTYEHDLARPALRRANVIEESGLHGRGRGNAGAGHRRQCGDLQCGECDAASPSAVRRPGQADNDPRNEAAAISRVLGLAG